MTLPLPLLSRIAGARDMDGIRSERERRTLVELHRDLLDKDEATRRRWSYPFFLGIRLGISVLQSCHVLVVRIERVLHMRDILNPVVHEGWTLSCWLPVAPLSLSVLQNFVVPNP